MDFFIIYHVCGVSKRFLVNLAGWPMELMGDYGRQLKIYHFHLLFVEGTSRFHSCYGTLHGDKNRRRRIKYFPPNYE